MLFMMMRMMSVVFPWVHAGLAAVPLSHYMLLYSGECQNITTQSTVVSAPETTHTDAVVAPSHQRLTVSLPRPSHGQPPLSRPPIGQISSSGPAWTNERGRHWRHLAGWYRSD